jgi:hypothetical protein
MRNALSLTLLVTILMSASSCIIVPGPRYHHRGVHRAAVIRTNCPPSYHWNGNACVHNGRAIGRYRR